jgi:hypothetical protein
MARFLPMPDVARLVTETQVASLDAALRSHRRPQAALLRAGMLVARGYRRRDWLLRRLLAVSDAVCLAVAMALVGGARGHSWQEYVLYGLITLPAWVVFSAQRSVRDIEVVELHDQHPSAKLLKRHALPIQLSLTIHGPRTHTDDAIVWSRSRTVAAS